MKNLKLIYICLSMFLGIVNFSCQHWDGETVVEGQVVDWDTGQAIPGATLKMYSHPSSSWWTWIDTKELEKQANQSGNFSFRFEADEGKSYTLQPFISKGSYTIEGEYFFLEMGKNNKKLKLKIRNPAWVKIKLTNQLPKDTIWLTIMPLNKMSNFQVDKLMRDTTIYALVAGLETRQIDWSYTSSRGAYVTGSKQINYPNPDTVFLEINY
jgi:hypothetical protein